MKRIAAGDRRLVITKNLIMMLVMLVVIFVAIFAWYTSNYATTAETTSISAQGADNVELALPNANGSFPISNDSWKSKIDFKDSPYCLKELVKDITSGGKQFVVPTFAAAKGLKEGRKVIADDVWTDGLSSREAISNTSTLDDDQYNYFSFDFYIRSKQKDIKVTADSFLAAGSELGYQDADHPSPDEEDSDRRSEGSKPLVKSSNTTIYRTSSYGKAEGQTGSFSSDAIVGAMRVSLEGCLVDGVSTSGDVTTETNYDGGTWEANSALRFLWLPRPDVYLNTDDNSNDWKLFTGIKPTGNDTQNGLTGAQVDALANQSYCHSFYEGEYAKNSQGQYVTDIQGNKIPKNLTPHKYGDGAVKTITGVDANVPSYFKVSDTRNDSHLGETGHYPTLGQSVKITGEPSQANLLTSKAIQFTPEEGDNRETTGYYVYKYTLNLWIEGEDAEARRSMNNGVFSLELDFGT